MLKAVSRCHYSDGSDNENVNKAEWVKISKTTALHVQHTFLYIVLAVTARLPRELPNFMFYRPRAHTKANFPFPFQTFPLEFNSRRVPLRRYTW